MGLRTVLAGDIRLAKELYLAKILRVIVVVDHQLVVQMLEVLPVVGRQEDHQEVRVQIHLQVLVILEQFMEKASRCHSQARVAILLQHQIAVILLRQEQEIILKIQTGQAIGRILLPEMPFLNHLLSQVVEVHSVQWQY